MKCIGTPQSIKYCFSISVFKTEKLKQPHLLPVDFSWKRKRKYFNQEVQHKRRQTAQTLQIAPQAENCDHFLDLGVMDFVVLRETIT